MNIGSVSWGIEINKALFRSRSGENIRRTLLLQYHENLIKEVLR